MTQVENCTPVSSRTALSNVLSVVYPVTTRVPTVLSVNSLLTMVTRANQRHSMRQFNASGNIHTSSCSLSKDLAFFSPFWNTVGPEIQQKIKKMWQSVNLIWRYYLSAMHYFNSSTCLYLLKTRVRPEGLRYPSALLTNTPETAQCRKQHRNAISKHQNSNKINQRPVECTRLFYWKSWKIIIKSFHPELVLLHS